MIYYICYAKKMREKTNLQYFHREDKKWKYGTIKKEPRARVSQTTRGNNEYAPDAIHDMSDKKSAHKNLNMARSKHSSLQPT